MTLPVGAARSTSPPASHPTPGPEEPGPARRGNAPETPLALGRAPTVPAGESAPSSHPQRRATLPRASAQDKGKAVAGSSGAQAVHGVTLTPTAAAASLAAGASSNPATQELLGLAGRLAGLERQHAQALRTLEAAAAPSSGPSAPASTSAGGKRLSVLKGHVDDAAAQLKRQTLARAGHLGELEKAERQLASRQQSLDALLAQAEATPTPAATAQAGASAATVTPPLQALAIGAPANRASGEELRLRAAVDRLADASTRATAVLDAANVQVAKATSSASRLHAEAEQMIEPQQLHAALVRHAPADLDQWLVTQGLPPARPPRPAADDQRFTAYLERFTHEVPGAAGGPPERRLKPEFEGPRAFMAFAALHDSQSPGVAPLDALAARLLKESTPAEGQQIAAAIRGGGSLALEQAIVPVVVPTLDAATVVLEKVASLPESEIAKLPRRHKSKSGQILSRANTRVSVQNSAQLVQLMHRHEDTLLANAIMDVGRLLGPSVAQYQQRRTMADMVAARRDASLRDQEAARQGAEAASSALKAARAELAQHVAAQREAAAAAAKPAATERPPTGRPAITETETVSRPDTEARIAKLRGEVITLGEQVETARQRFEQSGAAQATARSSLRTAEQDLDQAVAAHGRGTDEAQRKHFEAQALQAAQRAEVRDLQAQVDAARGELQRHPALATLIAPEALKRAIDRHVDMDDESLHVRARHETGRAGAYNSLGHLVEALVDVHETAARQHPQLFQARNAHEFAQAAAAIGGVVDRRHVHVRPPGAEPIARGYSNALEQTERPKPTNESVFSLRWHQGKVVVSHVHPHVPLH